jgi:hypothetical protein
MLILNKLKKPKTIKTRPKYSKELYSVIEINTVTLLKSNL